MKFSLIAAVAILMLCQCSAPDSSKSTNDISVSEAKQLMIQESNLLILDVRTPEEWAAGSINGAMKINFYDGDFSSKVSKLDNSQPVLVYCKKGGRSAKATSALETAGFSKIYNLLGGYDAYSKE